MAGDGRGQYAHVIFSKERTFLRNSLILSLKFKESSVRRPQIQVLF